jgi:hypothetical protein
LREPSGLALRVRATGARTFYFLHTRPGAKGTHKTFVGKFPAFKVAAARKRAKILAGDHAAGIDLIARKQERKQEAVKAAQEAASVTTFGSLVAERIEDGKDNCPYAVTRRDDEKIVKWKAELSAMRRNLSEHFSLDIRKIKRRHVMEAVKSLNAAGKRGASADLWKHSFGFFGWCIEEDYIDIHPLANAKRKRSGSNAERASTARKTQRAAISPIKRSSRSGPPATGSAVSACSQGSVCLPGRGAAKQRSSNGARCRGTASLSRRAPQKKADAMRCQEPHC